MFLFLLLMCTLILLVAFLIFMLSTCGAATILVFGDVIICVAIIIWILVKIVKR